MEPRDQRRQQHEKHQSRSPHVTTKVGFCLNLSVPRSARDAPARLRMNGKSATPMKAYRVSGTAPFGSQRQPFTYDIPAEDADAATDYAFSILGSRHRIKRRTVNIASVSEIDPRTSTEPAVLHHFREQIAAQGGKIAPQAEEE